MILAIFHGMLVAYLVDLVDLADLVGYLNIKVWIS